MRNVILFDDDSWEHLLPLTYTRPSSEIRCGILTIREKWSHYLEARTSHITQEHLSEAFPIHIEDDNLVINGNTLPNAKLVKLIDQLSLNEALMLEGDLIAARLSREQFDHLIHNEQVDELVGYNLTETPIDQLTRPWHIFQEVGSEIAKDYALLTKNRSSAERDKTCVWEGDDIFIEEKVSARHCIFDASEGPIYLGKNATLLAGSIIKGPFALNENAIVKMGAKIYGPTSIGPGSKVGGEIKNCVIFGHSAKSHDGYLGNAVIGQYCNLGADTNASNLRNDYKEVTVWNHALKKFEPSGLQFCGLIMADHSKCGINTMFNTGAVVGVSCNLFGGGFMPRFVPSFSWGGHQNLMEYRLDKALEVADRVLSRRGGSLPETERQILQSVHQLTQDQRGS